MCRNHVARRGHVARRDTRIDSSASCPSDKLTAVSRIARRAASHSFIASSKKIGAQNIHPESYASLQHHHDFFSQFLDCAKYTTTMFNFTTVTHKSSDFHHPLVMLTNREGAKFFFGKVPEGSQRILNENRIRLSRMHSIFLTGTITLWADIGGLPGLFLTISDATKNDVELYTGCDHISHFVVATWRYFVFRHGVKLNIKQADGIIGDSSMIVHPVKIAPVDQHAPPDPTVSNKLLRQLRKLVSLMFPLDTSKVNDPNPTSYKSDPSEQDIHTHVQLPRATDLADIVTQDSVNYLIRFLPVRGRFNPEAAKRLGVKPGVDFRNLTNGDAVKNDHGELVYPHQVIDKPKHFSKAIVLDIPSQQYLQPTISNTTWFRTDTEEYGPEPIGVVYHFLGDDIDFRLPEYSAFIGKFPPECKHIISHKLLTNNTLMFTLANISTLKLKTLQNGSFNLPHGEDYVEDSGDVRRLHSLQQVVVNTEGVTVDDSLVQKQPLSELFDEHIPEEYHDRKHAVLESEAVSLDPDAALLKDRVQVITLGTGSALPSIHRNVISSLVRVPRLRDGAIEYRLVLLDGGENTFGALQRNFGHGHLARVLQELRMIHLSHLHADHHLGLVSVITHWFRANPNQNVKLYLVVPWQFRNFVTEWYSLEGNVDHEVDLDRLVFISCEHFVNGDMVGQLTQVSLDTFEQRLDNNEMTTSREPPPPRDHAAIDALYEDVGISNIQTVRAIHCFWAYSISITFDLGGDTFKVSYSGDTRPNGRFVDIGHGSDLLIHEASLDGELIEEALAKKHSTLVEAVQVGRLMDCRKVILTHFSTRYGLGESVCPSTERLEALSADLKRYFEEYASPNIFKYYGQRDTADLADLDVCCAYDSMIIQYGKLHEQTHIRDDLRRIFPSEADASKKTKELIRQREKRETKRKKRLQMKKKRRVSSDELA